MVRGTRFFFIAYKSHHSYNKWISSLKRKYFVTSRYDRIEFTGEGWGQSLVNMWRKDIIL